MSGYNTCKVCKKSCKKPYETCFMCNTNICEKCKARCRKPYSLCFKCKSTSNLDLYLQQNQKILDDKHVKLFKYKKVLYFRKDLNRFPVRTEGSNQKFIPIWD